MYTLADIEVLEYKRIKQILRNNRRQIPTLPVDFAKADLHTNTHTLTEMLLPELASAGS